MVIRSKAPLPHSTSLLENFRFLESKIQQFTRRTDIDAGIRTLVYCWAGVSRVARPGPEARKQALCGLREVWNCHGRVSAVKFGFHGVMDMGGRLVV